MEPLIEVKHVSKEIQGNSILRDISFCVQPNEMVAIMGKSGSGKSTLLSIMAGLDTPSQGEIIYKGENLYEKEQKEFEQFRVENIGMIFQNYNLINELSCQENIEIPFLFSRRKRDLAGTGRLLSRMGLAEKAKIYPRQMSGGEQQRAAIARAIVNHPTVVYADEPTGALDSANAELVMEILKELKEAGENAIVIATHDADVAMWCDRTLVIKDGCLENIFKAAAE